MQLTHHYPARRLPDGTYEIRDLDIFAECSRLNPHTGDVDVFDADWLQAAAQRATERARNGYLAPVHLGHHDPARDDEPPFAGFLRELHVERYADATTPALLRATISGIPPEVFARIQAATIPYRSVEIHLPGEPEIASLALLESTVPFFKFPVTRVQPDADAADAEPQLMAAAATAPGSRILFQQTDEQLHCAGVFNGADELERAVHVALTRVHGALDDLTVDVVPDRADEGDTSPAWSEVDLQRELGSLTAAGFVFSEPAVRQLAERAPELPVLFAALRNLLPCAPLGSSRGSNAAPASSSPRAEQQREIAGILRDLNLPADADAARMAESAAIEFASPEPRFRAIGCTFTRADYIRSRLLPVGE